MLRIGVRLDRRNRPCFCRPPPRRSLLQQRAQINKALILVSSHHGSGIQDNHFATTVTVVIVTPDTDSGLQPSTETFVVLFIHWLVVYHYQRFTLLCCHCFQEVSVKHAKSRLSSGFLVVRLIQNLFLVPLACFVSCPTTSLPTGSLSLAHVVLVHKARIGS